VAGAGALKVGQGASPAAKDSCFQCHSVIEGTSVTFKDDVHYHHTISCADCHGGDSKEDDQNLSMSAERGFRIRVKRQATPNYCGRCHQNASFMRKFDPQLRVDQLALYKTSVHAKQLATGHTRSAECVDCHGVHNIRAVSDPLSVAHPRHVTETCAKCHAEKLGPFQQEHPPVAENCTICHNPHGSVNEGLLKQSQPNLCLSCHKCDHASSVAGTPNALLQHSKCTNCHFNIHGNDNGSWFTK